jgi:mannose-1-phosphate guanylyltransferase
MSVPLACYSLSLLDGIPINRLVVNSFHLPEKIRKFLRSLPPQWKELQICNEPRLLDSGGGIHNAKNLLQGRGDFFVLNGDEIILPHEMGLLKEMIAFHKWHEGIATLLTMEHPEVGEKFGGAWLTSEGTQIQCFSKKPPGPHAPRGLHYMGVLLLSEKIFRYFKQDVEVENILYDTLTAAINDGEKVHAFNCQSQWFEIGNPTDFMMATETCLNALSQQEKNPPFWQEYLKQTIRLYSSSQYFVENDWSRLAELKTLISKVKKGF